MAAPRSIKRVMIVYFLDIGWRRHTSRSNGPASLGMKLVGVVGEPDQDRRGPSQAISIVYQ